MEPVRAHSETAPCPVLCSRLPLAPKGSAGVTNSRALLAAAQELRHQLAALIDGDSTGGADFFSIDDAQDCARVQQGAAGAGARARTPAENKREKKRRRRAGKKARREPRRANWHMRGRPQHTAGEGRGGELQPEPRATDNSKIW